jgi:sugar O-acyltransferase (sialic acid O-acetyltransferase NeuD family)
MKNIVLFGGGTHVKYCIDIIHRENLYRIVGITDPFAEIGTEILGYKIIGRQEDINKLIPQYNIEAGLVTIGDNWIRKTVKDIVVNLVPNFEFVSTIHPSTIVGDNVLIEHGTVIMAGCIISPGAIIKSFCFLATGAILEHESIMEEFSSLSAGSVTGGRVKIGKYSAVTLGVVLFDRIEIGEHTVIGSGSLVTKDIPSCVLAYGSPAKIVRRREIGEKYLE